jgi:hypothetical protein
MVKTILKTDAAALMLSHFPVRKSTAFGSLGEFCLCGLRFNGDFTYPVHVIALLEGDNDDPVGN